MEIGCPHIRYQRSPWAEAIARWCTKRRHRHHHHHYLHHHLYLSLSSPFLHPHPCLLILPLQLKRHDRHNARGTYRGPNFDFFRMAETGSHEQETQQRLISASQFSRRIEHLYRKLSINICTALFPWFYTVSCPWSFNRS